MRATLLCLALLFPARAFAQTLPPEQIAYGQALKNWDAQLEAFRLSAVSTFDAEAAREKAPLCPDAHDTYTRDKCLSHEADLTEANYKAFTTALRSMLSLPVPLGPVLPGYGPDPAAPTQETINTSAFDAAELAWHTYATTECAAVDTLSDGGTFMRYTWFASMCNLRLARARLHELDLVYGDRLHPRYPYPHIFTP